MKQPSLILRFHSQKMLRTLDLGNLLEIVLHEYGDPLQVEFVSMTAGERAQAEDWTRSITLVTTRFTLWERSDDGNLTRREDLERRIVLEGRKQSPPSSREELTLRLTMGNVSEVLTKLETSVMTREEASAWARDLRLSQDAGSLSYDPSDMEPRLWKAIIFLEGFDLRTSSSEYLHTLDDLRDFRNENGL